MPMFRIAFAALIALCSALPALATGSGPVRRDHLSAELVAAQSTVAPGGVLDVALRLVHDEHWHTYWLNPGDSGLATRLVWTLPDGAQPGSIRWPTPSRLPLGPLVNFGYEAELLLPARISLPADLVPGSRFEASVKASWLVCKEECIPGDATLSLSLPVADAAVADPAWASRIAAAFAAEPPPVDWPATFSREGNDIVVHVEPREAVLDAATLEIFPIQQQVLATQRGRVAVVAGGALRIVTPVSDAFNAMPDAIDLLLVDGRPDSRRAVQVSARLSDAPLPTGTAVHGGDGAGSARPLGLLLALVLAFGGGVLLNLMPCVFPVLSLKAMGLAQTGGDAAQTRANGLAYLAGVLATFAALAGVLLALRAAGEQLGWGFQLQVPWVVAALALLMLAMGLSLSGLFGIGGGWMGAGQSLASRPGARGSFFTGVLAVVVASPCTAPFMGPALGFAVTQSAPAAIAVFLALGAGLAMPIVLLSLLPALARRLPRPGAWMETFKQAMAFPMYATAVWLAWVLGRQAGVDALALVLLGGVALAFGLWLLGRPGGALRGVGIAAGLTGALASVLMLPMPGGSTPVDRGEAAAASEPWSPERLAALRAEGRPVLVNMTAAWCITCLANERVALSSDAFRQGLATRGVAYLKGDWTNRDARITDYLAAFGRNGVPIYVVYPAGGGEPEVLPQLLTPALVDAALTRAVGP
jgi:thiol:disulfide interchange protein/DsbC/DsbD-like thiol-disulfide interchange protein